MPKISKVLTNVIHISGRSEEIQKFIKNVKESKIKVISVRFPKDLTSFKSITDFIDNKWKIAKMDLEDKIIYARQSSTEIFIVFSNDNLEHYLLEQVEKFNLDFEYKYVLEDTEKSIIAIEEYRDGELIEDDIFERIENNGYSIAFCLV